MSALQARTAYIAQRRQAVDKLNKEVKQTPSQVAFYEVKARVEINSSHQSKICCVDLAGSGKMAARFCW